MFEIVRPTLLLNEAICKSNIRSIAEKARKENINLRPHFKTHQSHVIGDWCRDEGITTCTVSSVKMASYFAQGGWNDITIAFPINFRESTEINRLASTCKLNILVMSADAVVELGQRLTSPVQCLIEIDPGNNRTGLGPTDHDSIDKILSAISSNRLMSFAGFLTHAGQSYSARTRGEIMKIHQDTIALMRRLGDHYGKYSNLVLSVGDTPTCSLAEDFNGITEIRPGNLVFYDLMQANIGSCTKEQIAIAMACPVVAINEARNEIFVHGGGVHFSKDFLKRDDGTNSFGEVVSLNDKGWETNSTSMYLKSISQEHGVVSASTEEIKRIKVGDVIGVLPVHACLTADAMGEYRTLEGKLIGMMKK